MSVQGRLRRTLEGEHAGVPCLTGQPVGDPASLGGLLGGGADLRAVDWFAGFAAHADHQSAAAAVR